MASYHQPRSWRCGRATTSNPSTVVDRRQAPSPLAAGIIVRGDGVARCRLAVHLGTLSGFKPRQDGVAARGHAEPVSVAT
jgi:hypothetical protein